MRKESAREIERQNRGGRQRKKDELWNDRQIFFSIKISRKEEI